MFAGLLKSPGATQSYKLAKIRQLATRRSSIDAYYASHPVAKLNIGCGPTAKPGWLNIDIDPRYDGAVLMDATKPLPLPDSSVDFVYSEHMIEHVPLPAAVGMLKEIHRVLRPDGRIRIATPDMDNIIHLKAGNLSPAELSYIRWSNTTFGNEFERASPDNPCLAINRMFREWGHQFVYDRATFGAVLSHAGFCDVVFCQIGESEVPEFKNVETHGTIVGPEFNKVETMIAEGLKA